MKKVEYFDVDQFAKHYTTVGYKSKPICNPMAIKQIKIKSKFLRMDGLNMFNLTRR